MVHFKTLKSFKILRNLLSKKLSKKQVIKPRLNRYENKNCYNRTLTRGVAIGTRAGGAQVIPIKNEDIQSIAL